MSRKPYASIEEMIARPSISQPAVSEDGAKVAWVVSTTDWDKDRYLRYVQVYDTALGQHLSLTHGDKESFSPAWSNEGRLAWLSPTGEKENRTTQIFLLHQGQPVQVTNCKGGVSKYQWSPCGQGIIYLGADPAQKEALKRRQERYGDFVYVDIDTMYQRLFYVEVEQGLNRSMAVYKTPKDQRCDKADIARRLVQDHSLHVINFDISPSGEEVVFTATPTPNIGDREDADIYILSLKDEGVQCINVAKPIEAYGRVLYSPSGHQICYTRPIDEGKWYNISTVEVMDLKTKEIMQPLRHIDEAITPVRWTLQGLVFGWQQRTDWYVSMLTNLSDVIPLQVGQGQVTLQSSVNAQGTHVATITASREQPFDLYLNQQKITKQDTYLKGRAKSKKEIVSWSSGDGTIIEGVLITPSELDPNTSYPLLVLVHGGPSWAAMAIPTTSRNYPYEQFIAKGFIILDVNYRGSSGYGNNFRKLNYRNLGIGDYEDVISGVDKLIEQGMVDGDRVGIMGWSQGGYISAMCATYSNRFKAISVGAGISNWYTYYNNTDITPFTLHYLGDTPWNDYEIYARTSPMTYIKQACTPTLIQHGDSDVRVPAPNAVELYRGLKDMGVSTTLVMFKGMGHNANKPGLNRAIMQQNLTWFCHHLLGEPLDDLWLNVPDKAR